MQWIAKKVALLVYDMTQYENKYIYGQGGHVGNAI